MLIETEGGGYDKDGDSIHRDYLLLHIRLIVDSSDSFSSSSDSFLQSGSRMQNLSKIPLDAPLSALNTDTKPLI